MEGGSTGKGWCGGKCTPQSVNQSGGEHKKRVVWGKLHHPSPQQFVNHLRKKEIQKLIKNKNVKCKFKFNNDTYMSNLHGLGWKNSTNPPRIFCLTIL